MATQWRNFTSGCNLVTLLSWEGHKVSANHWDNSVYFWDITTCALKKQTSVILQYYFRITFRPCQRHRLFLQRTKFHPNRTTCGENMTSYRFSRWQRRLSAKGKGKGKGLGTCYSATYMSQTRDQQRFTISEVAADWHELLLPVSYLITLHSSNGHNLSANQISSTHFNLWLR